MKRVALSVAGVSLGDSFGDWFFWPQRYPPEARTQRVLPPRPWRYTDDTVMAVAVASILERHGRIEQDNLAHAFALGFWADVHRGYGSGAVEILESIHSGVHWKIAAGSAFGGSGSLGNGGAMRATPVGAYFADEPDRVVEEAYRSAAVTHAHKEGQVGAAAVALAASFVVQDAGSTGGRHLIDYVVGRLPKSEVRSGLVTAANVPLSARENHAAGLLGNGGRITAPDTVPFSLWCAAKHLANFEEAMWAAASVGGDCDTLAAIVGGIVSLSVGSEGLPADWLARQEPLPTISD